MERRSARVHGHGVTASDGSTKLLLELLCASSGGQPAGAKSGDDLIDFLGADGRPKEWD
jgi:hypothetical protein